MRETDEELGEIKREIIESRALVIKTNNLTNALSADVKSIAKRQATYEGRIRWNSATAYVVFVVVVFGALKLTWDARVDQIKAETEGHAQEVTRLRKEVKDANARDEDRARAEAKALAFYDLVRQGKRQDVVEQWGSLEKEPLSKAERAFYTDVVGRTKAELAISLWLQGLDKMKLQRWQEAVNLFEESLRLKGEGEGTPRVRLSLAESLKKLGRFKDAIPTLTALSEGTVDRDVQDDALYLLAQCHTELQSWNDAKEAYRNLIRRFPDSSFAPQAKMYLAQLNAIH